MKILLCYFSGTKNGEFLANELKKSLPNLVSYEITYPFSSLPNVKEYDLLGFLYPVHAFRCPEVVVSFARQLMAFDKPYFIISNSGEPLCFNKASSDPLIHVLKRKKYVYLFEEHFVLPYNIIYRHSDSLAKSLYLSSSKRMPALASKIERMSKEPRKMNPFLHLVPPLFAIEWPFAKHEAKFFKINTKTCLNCQKCLQECPMHNIVVQNGKLKFLNHCALCLRCSFYCPTNSIKIGMFEKRWKVHGSYQPYLLLKDTTIPLFSEGAEPKGFLNKRYYRYLKEKDI
jgi:Pyruvate/2-oxoacid:ferredoxin oxidoreductase delta subunit